MEHTSPRSAGGAEARSPPSQAAPISPPPEDAPPMKREPAEASPPRQIAAEHSPPPLRSLSSHDNGPARLSHILHRQPTPPPSHPSQASFSPPTPDVERRIYHPQYLHRIDPYEQPAPPPPPPHTLPSDIRSYDYDSHANQHTKLASFAAYTVPPSGPSDSSANGVAAAKPAKNRDRAANGGGGVTKSRKSSCDLCHHRKIRCDQARPACGSCVRKGHACHYADADTPSKPRAPSKSNGTGSTKISLTIPSPNDTSPSSHGYSPSRHTATPRNGERSAPEWSAVKGSAARDHDVYELGPSGLAPLMGKRGVNGYDDSDEEARRSSDRSMAGELVELAEIATASASYGADEDVDELESMNGGDNEGDSRTSKRTPEDDVNGDLENGHHKRKKSRVSAANNLSVPHSSMPYRPRHSLKHRQSHRHPSPTIPSMDPYGMPLQALLHQLPSSDTQSILFNTFFTDPFLTEGISLLQPQYLDDFRRMMTRASRLREGDATTLACAFAFLAVALRILPEETSKLLLAQSGGSPDQSFSRNQTRSLARLLVPSAPSAADSTPLDQRYFDLAILAMQLADQWDMPSVMLVMCKLTLVRFLSIKNQMAPVQSGPMTLAGGWLAAAIKIAHTLGMGKEWEGINQGERELRRRVMWSLYIADRHWSFITANPYTILDAHQGIHLPSPISESDLYKIPADAAALPSHNTEVGPTSCTALFIHTHLARRITPILDSFSTVSPSNTPHDLVVRFDSSLDAFQDALPPYFRLYPMTDTHWDSAHPYLPPHRVRLHSTLLSYRMGVHRAHLATYLLPATPSHIRSALASYCLAMLRVQRSAKMLDPKLAPRLFSPTALFESAATLGLLMFVDKMLGGAPADVMLWRGGVVDAEEMLDNVFSGGDAGAFSRKSVKVIREIMTRISAIPSLSIAKEEHVSPRLNGHAPHPHANESAIEDDTPPPPRGGPPTAREERVNHITAWLERLLTDGMRMEALLREPEWEGGWDKIVGGM